VQINVDKKSGIYLGIIAILVVALAATAISRRSDDGVMGMHDHGTSTMGNSTSSTSLTGADIMFLQMMIPHHQQAVDISNLALTKSSDTELLALAKAIRDGQAAEIIQMKNWLQAAGASESMGHDMGDHMGGMLIDSELAALNSATGKKFDQLWLTGMTGHYEGALHMTTMIQDATNPAIKEFGQNILTVQTAQINQMAAMIKRLS